jgi:hypothetical protein
MRVVPGPDGWPMAYEYAVGSETVRFSAHGEERPPILHLTLFHPTDDHYGLSPMEAAATALDIHNAAGAWNKALLDNAARPSGALVVGATSLTDAQFDRLKEELEASYQGALNAGRPLLLEGGLDWKPLSLSPQDMDFVEAKAAAAREIALAFGVPPLLLGLPGDNTHANYAEANRAFYRQTVIPLARRTADALAAWLGPSFGERLALEPDLDAIEALADERESLWRRVAAAPFLSDDESAKPWATDAGPHRPSHGSDAPLPARGERVGVRGGSVERAASTTTMSWPGLTRPPRSDDRAAGQRAACIALCPSGWPVEPGHDTGDIAPRRPAPHPNPRPAGGEREFPRGAATGSTTRRWAARRGGRGFARSPRPSGHGRRAASRP